MNRFERLVRKLQRSGKGTPIPHEEIPEKLTSLTGESTRIQILVTPRSGNPIFDSLPSILESALDEVDIDIVFNKKGSTDDKTLQKLAEIRDAISVRRGLNLTLANEYFKNDLQNLDLELQDGPHFNYLVALVQDPSNKNQYWFRKIGMKPGVFEHEGYQIPYVDWFKISLPPYDEVPIPEEHLLEAVKMFSEFEEKHKEHPNKEVRDLQASVGIVRYKGPFKVSLDNILSLTACKYNQLIQQQSDNPVF